ncbi:MAG: OmpH family outer membrane protein [Nitrospinae bacterium]|nr:OmpH family outer membrane protein [Nitrospinota bacterium]
MKRHRGPDQIRNLLVSLALACAVLLLAGPVVAEPVKIGYVDIQRVIDESTIGLRANAKLRKDFERRAAELKNMEKELEQVRLELDSKGSVMSAERRRQLEEEFRRDRRDFKRADRDNSEEFNIKRKQLLIGILPKIVKAVQTIGKEQGYTLILQNKPDILLYLNDRVDVTSEVIARLNVEAPAQ